MSSGGFYKYRCKYFMTHNCQNWVYVNGASCQQCVAAGRDAVDGGNERPAPSSNQHVYDGAMAPRGGLVGPSFTEIVPPMTPLAPIPLGEESTLAMPKHRDDNDEE